MHARRGAGDWLPTWILSMSCRGGSGWFCLRIQPRPCPRPFWASVRSAWLPGDVEDDILSCRARMHVCTLLRYTVCTVQHSIFTAADGRRHSHDKGPAGRPRAPSGCVVSLLREGIDPSTSLRPTGMPVPRFSLLGYECGGSFCSKSAAALPCRVHNLRAVSRQRPRRRTCECLSERASE